MNALGLKQEAFLFITDFEFTKALILKQNEIDSRKIKFSFGKHINFKEKNIHKPLKFDKFPCSFETYDSSFKKVMNEIHAGNTYLLNLTFQSAIQTNYSLEDIFYSSRSPFKLLYKDVFVVFSPEIFVRIKNGRIYSYPMKGTIDASIPDAHNIILNKPKEIAEHHTIVDLIRNDLNMVSSEVKLEKFRYIDKIKTNQKNLLQVSSEISGILPEDFNARIGNIFEKLLPAGSVSGAPKHKTLEIIHAIENFDRKFYTGIAGFFDGKALESFVMIRFIEKQGEQLFFKSGGGITFLSSPFEEYQEMIDKIYLSI